MWQLQGAGDGADDRLVHTGENGKRQETAIRVRWSDEYQFVQIANKEEKEAEGR